MMHTTARPSAIALLGAAIALVLLCLGLLVAG